MVEPPAEHLPAPDPRLIVPPLDEPDPRVQMNVRIPKSLRDTIDLRRATLGLSRDEWIRRAVSYALSVPPGSQESIQTMNGHRSVRLPRC